MHATKWQSPYLSPLLLPFSPPLLLSALVNVLANQRSFLLSNLSAATTAATTIPRASSSPLTSHSPLSLYLSIYFSLVFLRDIFDRENLGWIFSNLRLRRRVEGNIFYFFVREKERIDGFPMRFPLENRRFFRPLCRILAWLRERTRDLINERARETKGEGRGERKTGGGGHETIEIRRERNVFLVSPLFFSSSRDQKWRETKDTNNLLLD